MNAVDVAGETRSDAGRPLLDEPVPRYAMVILVVGVVVPFMALLAAIPVAWGWGLSWLDIAIGIAFYLVS